MIYLARFLALRYWLRHRGAFFLSTLGVTLGLAVFVSIQVANHSVLASFAASLDAVTGKANLQIVGGPKGLPEDVFARLLSTQDPTIRDNVRAASPLINRTLYSPTLKSSLLVLGVDLFSEADFRDYNLSASQPRSSDFQSLARFLLDPQAMALSASLAKRHNLKTGDAIVIYVGAQRRRFRITTLLDSEAAGRAFGGDFALVDIASAQENFAQLGRLSQIDLIVDEKGIDAVSLVLGEIAPRDAIVQRPIQRGTQVADLLSAFQLNLSALSSIALFVGAFLIYNAIAIAVVRRRSEVGTLRAVGASRSQIMRLFLLEAAVIGAVGSVLGFALGLLLAKWTLGAVSTTVSSLYIAVRAREISVPIWLWWAAPLGGTLLSVLASLPAAWEAANTSPRAAMQRATLHHTATSFAWPMAVLGIASLLLAVILCQPFVSSKTVFAGFAASFFTLGGFALLAPLFTLGGGALAQRVGGAVFGIEGTLAGSYLQRALNRSSLVIAALMVSLAMAIGMAVMVGSFRQTVADWVSTTISADLYIAPATGFSGDFGPGLPPEVVRYAREIPNLRSIDTIRNIKIQIGQQPILIAANELPTLATGERRMRFLETANGEKNAIREFTQNRAVLVSERFKNLIGPGAGDSLVLPTPQGNISFRIAGVFYDYTPNECLIYLPRPLFQKYWRDDAIDGIALYLPKGVSTESVKQDLQRKFAARYQLTLLQNREIRESVFKTFDQTFAVTYALQLIAVIVAAIGIFDTLIALLLERGRELATLRAVGASSIQIQKITFLEFTLIGFFAWLLGSVAGVCLAWELIAVINRQFFGWTIQPTLPPTIFAQALILSLLAAVGSGILPARAAACRNLSEALQME